MLWTDGGINSQSAFLWRKYYCQMPGPGAELVGVWCFVNNARGFPRLTFEYAESHIGSLL